MLSLCGLGIQYFIKSKLSYDNLLEIKEELYNVEYYEFNNKYNKRDVEARKTMKELIDLDKNKVEKVFSTLI